MHAKFLLVLLVIPAFASAQANLGLGDDLRQYLNAYPPKYKTSGLVVLPIAEGTIDIYKYKAATTDIDLKILVINDKWPVGVLQIVDGKSQILMDLDGDGKLDTVDPSFLVPFWVVAKTPLIHKKAARIMFEDIFRLSTKAFNLAPILMAQKVS